MNSGLLFGGNIVAFVFNTLALAIDSIIYWTIEMSYNVFRAVSKVNLFESDTSNAINSIMQRVYVIIGVVMLFVFTYNILQMIIDPDKTKDGKGYSGLIKNIIISIILLSLSPVVFNYAHQVQDDVIESGILSNIILGGTESNFENAGTQTAITIFSAFYHPVDADGTPYSVALCENSSLSICKTYVTAYNSALQSGRINDFTQNAELKDAIDEDMEYIKVISAVCGVVAMLMFVSFTLDVGIRVAKLAFLEIIAPVPIILRATKPSGGIFDKWLNEYKKEYLSLFSRLIVIYSAMLLISLITTVDIFGKVEGTPIVKMLANVALILGILNFAKQVPKLLESISGQSLRFEFSPKAIRNKIRKTPIVGKPLDYVTTKPIGALHGALTGGLGRASIAFQNNGEKLRPGNVGNYLKSGFRSAGKGFKYGAVGGAKKGGGQFNAQRTEGYHNLTGNKGNPSIFGHQQVGDFIQGKMDANIKSADKNALENMPRKFVEEAVDALNKTPVQQTITDMYDKIKNEIKADRISAFNAKQLELNTNKTARTLDDLASTIMSATKEDIKKFDSVHKDDFVADTKYKQLYSEEVAAAQASGKMLTTEELRNNAVEKYIKTAEYRSKYAANADKLASEHQEAINAKRMNLEDYKKYVSDAWKVNPNKMQADINNYVDKEMKKISDELNAPIDKNVIYDKITSDIKTNNNELFEKNIAGYKDAEARDVASVKKAEQEKIDKLYKELFKTQIENQNKASSSTTEKK